MWVIILNIAFVNLMKKDDNSFSKRIKYNVNNRLNRVYEQKGNFFVYNFNEKTKMKLIKKLKKYDYALVEEKENINFPTLMGQTFTKYMIYEIYINCKRKNDEITICTNTYCGENVEIIKDLASKIKVVNIVTDLEEYYNLDKILEKQNIYITVSSNRRKSLKNVDVMVNLDFKSIRSYNFNRNMTIIDLTGNIEIPKAFNGKLIRKLGITTPKKLRIFAEHENFDKSQLIEYQILNKTNYEKVREYLAMNKIKIETISM